MLKIYFTTATLIVTILLAVTVSANPQGGLSSDALCASVETAELPAWVGCSAEA